MAKKKKELSGVCVYCGTFAKLTEDHIPPQCLFPNIPRDQLIHVPACFRCNNGASKDDEWFRLNLAMRDDVDVHSDNQEIIAAVLRSLARPQAQGMRSQFLAGVHEIDVVTKSGLFVERRTAYNVDLDRLSRVPSRVVKGLFWKHTGRRLPDAYEVVTYAVSGLQPTSMEQRDRIRVLLGSLIEQQQIWGVGESFRYLLAFTSEDPTTSIWLTLFFQRIAFVSFIVPKRRASGPA